MVFTRDTSPGAVWDRAGPVDGRLGRELLNPGGNMAVGVVKWFNAEKGYGFITADDGTDIFVHFTGIDMPGFRQLEPGATVEFDVGAGRQGKQAENVRPLQSS